MLNCKAAIDCCCIDRVVVVSKIQVTMDFQANMIFYVSKILFAVIDFDQVVSPQ